MRFKRRGFGAPSALIGATGSLGKVAILLVLVVLAGTVVFLATAEISPPAQSVEKVIPDSRFPR